MKAASISAPLFREQDSVRIRDEIKAILATGANVFRPTDFQVKVGRRNYYLTTGRIFIDGEGSCQCRGIEAFVKMIR